MLSYQNGINLERLLGQIFEDSSLDDVKVLRWPFSFSTTAKCCVYSYTDYDG